MDIIDVSELEVRAVVLRLRHRDFPLRFTFYPMVHVAARRFYDDVADRLAEHQLVVAEGVQGSSRRVEMLKLACRLAGGNRRLGLVRQPRQLADGVPTIHPDMTAVEFNRRWRKLPLAERLLVGIAAPAVAIWMRVGASRRFLARRLALDDDIIIDETVENPTEFVKLLGDARDKLLIDALATICADHQDNMFDVAVVYGAQHVQPAIRYLTALHGYVVVAGDWLTVFDL